MTLDSINEKNIFENIDKGDNPIDVFMKYASIVEAKNMYKFDSIANTAFDMLAQNTGNVLIVGEHGIGKTSLVSHMQYMLSVDKSCRPDIHGKRIFKLEYLRLIEMIQMIKDYEIRLFDFLNSSEKSEFAYIFIDEFFRYIKDNNINSATDFYTAKYIKSGKIHIIGCVSNDEYAKMDKMYDVLKYFNVIKLKEPSISDTIDIMKHNLKGYENMYGVKISNDIIDKIVNLSDKYIKDSKMKMPLKAESTLSLACSHALANSYVIGDNLTYFNEFKKAEEKLAELIKENTANDLEYYNAQKKLTSLINKISENSANINLSENDIYDVVSILAGVPVAKLTESDQTKYKNMETELNKIVIGQEEVISKICKTIKRNRLGIRKNNHTVGNFMFVGTTGVGKTMLAKELTKYQFGSYDSLIRLDMSEYTDSISVNKLIGAPPGYVGYGEGGILCNAIKNNPYTVILFDEIEKAHPAVYDAILQLLDEGHITDANGNKISAMNCVIIMTSNIGMKESSQLSQGVGFSVSEEEAKRREKENTSAIIKKNMDSKFSPEFLNRIDSICYFNQLSENEMKKIFDNEFNEVSDAISKIGYTVKLDSNVSPYIVKKACKEKLGARPIIRLIQQEIADEITDMIINEQFTKKTIKVKYDDKKSKLVFK